MDIKSAFENSTVTTKPVSMNIDFGNGLNIQAKLETTNKGNEILSLPNLSLRLQDLHDDGLVYKNGTLRFDVMPPNRYPYSTGFIISGLVIHTSEKESDTAIEDIAVFVYIWSIQAHLSKF